MKTADQTGKALQIFPCFIKHRIVVKAPVIAVGWIGYDTF